MEPNLNKLNMEIEIFRYISAFLVGFLVGYYSRPHIDKYADKIENKDKPSWTGETE